MLVVLYEQHASDILSIPIVTTIVTNHKLQHKHLEGKDGQPLLRTPDMRKPDNAGLWILADPALVDSSLVRVAAGD